MREDTRVLAKHTRGLGFQLEPDTNKQMVSQ